MSRVTLSRYLIEQTRSNNTPADLRFLIEVVARACKAISHQVSKGALGGVPVAGILGDQHAALMGQTCFTSGEAKNTYGTGCFALLVTGAEPVPSKHRLLTTVAWQLGGRRAYALEGSIFSAGAAVQWVPCPARRDGPGCRKGGCST